LSSSLWRVFKPTNIFGLVGLSHPRGEVKGVAGDAW